MRVLVTGNRGYIGSILAPTIRDAGHDVVGLDTDYYAGCDFDDPSADATQIETIVMDVRDVTAADVESFDAVVHFAALSNDPIGSLNADWTYDINLDGSIRLARAARDAGVGRFVFASSCSMYGASGTDAALDESAPLNPLTAYAESKVAAEREILELARDGFSVVSMRNATVYGVSPRLRLDIVLNNLAGSAVTSGAIRLLSDGTAWRPMLHVRDLARAAAAILAAPAGEVSGEAINIGSDAQNYVVTELADVLADVTSCRVEYADEASPDPRSYRVDFSKFARMFPSFEFEWNAARGAEELVTAYRSAGMSTEVFEGRAFVRLRQLRHLLDNGELTDGLRWQRVPGKA
jgi:nucleoside-diphosphate-sugar epimerase